ncbi:MAG: NAD(P)-dependent oxidoreductase [Actinobacteria bacterium]|nr:NAD(P)-dependent oxidoreductase [Actinomycetota bacterium]
MYEIDSKLDELEKRGNPIKVGLIGAGQMGSEIITQLEKVKGIRIVSVVDISLEKALAGYKYLKKDVEIVKTNNLKEAEKAIGSGKKIASTNYKLATSLPQIEVVIEATGSIEMGALIALDAINNKKHIIMMSVECDVTVGPILRKFAENAGVIYSLAAGDEPSAIIELYRFANALGFTVIAVGKGKNNPLNIYATPEILEESSRKRNMNAVRLCEFVDGSKTAIEMAAVSNATGFVPDIRGMHGANSKIDEITKIFCPKKDGGILNNIGVVDFAIGVHPGVFLVFTTDNQKIREALIQRNMGYGPYYLLYRPYHLCSIEVPLTIAQIAIYGESSGHPMGKLTSECIVITKKNMKAGEILDGVGEYCYRVSIERMDIAKKENFLPMGLTKGSKLKVDVKKDTIITNDMVKIQDDTTLFHLRKIQDNLCS